MDGFSRWHPSRSFKLHSNGSRSIQGFFPVSSNLLLSSVCCYIPMHQPIVKGLIVNGWIIFHVHTLNISCINCSLRLLPVETWSIAPSWLLTTWLLEPYHHVEGSNSNRDRRRMLTLQFTRFWLPISSHKHMMILTLLFESEISPGCKETCNQITTHAGSKIFFWKPWKKDDVCQELIRKLITL